MNAAAAQPTEVVVEAVVLGPDGQVKRDLGTVAYYHRNPLKRWWGKLNQRGGLLNRGD